MSIAFQPERSPAVAPFAWPEKLDVLGVGISPTTYEAAVGLILDAAESHCRAIVACQAVHAVVTAARDAELRRRVNSFDLVTPDGQPVRWALNWLYRTRLAERVYGPELMWRVCHEAAVREVPVYLYGGTQQVLEKLQARLMRTFPKLQIAGSEAPPFRPLTDEEDREVVKRINASGARLVFIGLGCPKQDHFAFDHRDRVEAVQLCVGAAFDFHAGTKPMAPAWMQGHGLEWLFRLCCEPRRLARRYLVTNTLFVVKLAAQIAVRRVALPRDGWALGRWLGQKPAGTGNAPRQWAIGQRRPGDEPAGAYSRPSLRMGEPVARLRPSHRQEHRSPLTP